MDWKFEKNMYPILDTRVDVQISYSIYTKIQAKVLVLVLLMIIGKENGMMTIINGIRLIIMIIL